MSDATATSAVPGLEGWLPCQADIVDVPPRPFTDEVAVELKFIPPVPPRPPPKPPELKLKDGAGALPPLKVKALLLLLANDPENMAEA